MTNRKWLRSHVERCLQDVWDVCRVEVDDDGDYPFRGQTSVGFIHIERVRPAMIRIFAIAARDVPRSARLLRELNDVNEQSRFAWACWSRSRVVVEQAIHIKAVNRGSIRHALNAVIAVADDIGPMIAAVYGGETPLVPGEATMTEGAA